MSELLKPAIKPVDDLPAPPLTDKKEVERFNDVIVVPICDSDIQVIVERKNEMVKEGDDLGVDDYTNIAKGVAQQKSLEALGFEPNTNFSLKTAVILAVVIGLIIAAIKIFG